MTDNPLLQSTELPQFSRIRAEQVAPAVERILADNRAVIARVLEQAGDLDWDALVRPLDDADDRLHRAWAPVGHLNAVVNSEELRAAYNQCLPLLSEYATEVGQNERLFQAYQRLAESPEYAGYDTAQRKVVENALRDFHLSGVDLPPERKERYKQIAQELSTLQSQFQDNLLDATQAWSKHFETSEMLAGIPESARAIARQAAERKELSGWLFTLEFPSYVAVMTYADDRELRREFYEAFTTRASDQGPNAGRWDNSPLMERILALRHEQAALLGYESYAALSLATKMAESPGQVLGFLEDLAERSMPVARADLDDLRHFARAQHGLDELAAWDLGYYAEKLRQHRYAYSEEEVRAYFPAARAVSGLFAVVERLYGIRVTERPDVDTWDPSVSFYDVYDRDGQRRGSFYLDLYARPNKRGGAWMDDCVARRRCGDHVQLPVAFLTCNFTPPAGETPSLLRHDEVVTLFHEFGHGFHHLLTRVDQLGVSGIRGVEWDAVELPSQFMENFCWEREAIALLSGHYQTGEPLPDALFERMLAAKHFQAGMQMVRQLEFALFDFRLHDEYDPERGGRIQETLDRVRARVAVVIPPAYNRFQHSFGHIFAGGYAAGYYSYKWAEVLSADAFSRFEEEGIFNPDTGASFLSNVLEQGGSRKAMELFVGFRGREPRVEALLRHSGIVAAA